MQNLIRSTHQTTTGSWICQQEAEIGIDSEYRETALDRELGDLIHKMEIPEKQKLLIIISDGQPADTGYYGTEAEADLRGIKKEYSKKGIKLFAAAIGDDKENIKRIYQDGFLDITKLEDLPKNMTLLVKQYLK